ncbi:TetR/AcrR family transcriptional regulator [Streptomyces sp. OR43]|uniref:TetR/AcrR family transcriptional regulator n=1 Tax=Streptomyces sp. or43 TaxID=2478957 RepID=UPI0011CE8C4F|nr:TetR/AcrR family transcriptional regulator [Streptomyces sp. or43]TXS38122.1 TetR/AcrR family transcriptional regulator [Streptomyces sp. or43]
MKESSRKSAYGDPEARRRMTLDAAAALLDEGGYTALTIRSVAQRSGTSTGLIYQYFADKEEIFIALLIESQIESTAFVEALPRDGGVAALIASVIPQSARQWGRVGRLTATWSATEGDARYDRTSVVELRHTSRLYDEALHAAVIEAASQEGRRLRDDAPLLRFVVAGLIGVSETLVNNWAPHLDQSDLIHFAAEAITRGITAPGSTTDQPG